jgi:hypothetical protein
MTVPTEQKQGPRSWRRPPRSCSLETKHRKEREPVNLAPIRKALISTAGAAVAGIGAAMTDGALTVPECIAAAGAALVFGFATWRVPNSRP